VSANDPLQQPARASAVVVISCKPPRYRKYHLPTTRRSTFRSINVVASILQHFASIGALQAHHHGATYEHSPTRPSVVWIARSLGTFEDFQNFAVDLTKIGAGLSMADQLAMFDFPTHIVEVCYAVSNPALAIVALPAISPVVAVGLRAGWPGRRRPRRCASSGARCSTRCLAARWCDLNRRAAAALRRRRRPRPRLRHPCSCGSGAHTAACGRGWGGFFPPYAVASASGPALDE